MNPSQLIHNFKTLFNSAEKKRLLSNFFSLSMLQAANYILPFLTLPYLVTTLGVEYFGLLAFATAMITYFVIITDYGFNLTATREISKYRDDRNKVIEIFSSVMMIKFVLLVLSFIVMTILIFSIDKFSKDWLVYVLTFGVVIGHFLFPVWFFQGMERMSYITYLNILSKLIFTIAIFLFVQKQSDFYLVPILTSLGLLIAGICSLIIIKTQFDITFKWQNLSILKKQLDEGWHIFLSQFQISLFSTSNIVILGFLTNNTAVGYYSGAEKIMRALAMMQTPIVGALFPFVAKKIHENKANTMFQLKKLIRYGSIVYLIILLPIFIFADNIVHLLYTDSMANSAIVLQIIIIIPLTIFLNNIFGTQIMLNTHQEKKFFKIVLIAGLSNLLLCTTFSYYFSYIGTAISLLIIEIYIMLAMYFSVRKDLQG